MMTMLAVLKPAPRKVKNDLKDRFLESGGVAHAHQINLALSHFRN